MGYTEGTEHGTAETAPAPEHPADGGREQMPTSKRTTAPAFQFYPKDFLTSPKVRRMSMTERGVYITLLSLCWLDGSLSTDPAELAEECRISRKQFERLWKNSIVAQCFVEREGRLHNERLDEERRKQKDYKRRQSDNAGKRWDSHRKNSGNATALPAQDPSHASGNALQSSSSSSTPVVPTTKNVVGTARPQSIVQPRRRDAAFEYGRLYVPQRAHSDLAALHPQGFNLFAWYERIAEDWTYGAHKDAVPGADMIKFWKARHDEEWPPAAVTVSARTPAWAR